MVLDRNLLHFETAWMFTDLIVVKKFQRLSVPEQYTNGRKYFFLQNVVPYFNSKIYHVVTRSDPTFDIVLGSFET